MKKKYIFKLIFAIIVTSVSLLILFNTFEAKSSLNESSYKTIIVKRGDTLWSIARDNCSEYKDIRKAVYEIRKLNNFMSANITPGQRIIIP